jgi:uncharacterized protein (TIGR01777 family)
MGPGHIVLAGGSGFLGRTLTKWLAARGRTVVVLCRREVVADGARVVLWDGRTSGPWAKELEQADALINLAGRSVNCRYTARNRRAMMDSRIESTRVLGEAVARCQHPPHVWLNSSTATIYKHTFGEAHDEHGVIGASAEAHDAFSIEVATAWERAFDEARTPATRKVALRTAMVFGNEPGGVYEVLRRLAKLGLGGRMGDGRQFVSWIHAEDFCRAIQWLIDTPAASGVYNICAPQPVTNAEMMAIIRRAVGRSIGLPATRWMLEVVVFVLRTETELILKSRRAVPARLLSERFTFEFPTMDSAVRALEHEAARAIDRAPSAGKPAR